MSIYIGSNQVSTIYNGGTSSSAVYLGSYKTWPVAAPSVITYDITAIAVHYSSGTKIDASGSNYAYVTGTYTTFVDDVSTSSTTVNMTPVFYSGDSGVWTVTGNNITAADRYYLEGAERTGSFTVSYGNITYSGKAVIHQQANAKTLTGFNVANFLFNGNSASSQTFDASSHTISVTTQLTRTTSYTSGHTASEMTPENYYAYTISSTVNGSSGSWATVNYADGTSYGPSASSQSHAGCKLSSISMPANSATSDRNITVTVKDSYFTSGTPGVISATQYGTVDWGWTWSTSNPLSIGEDATSFTLRATSTRNGSPFSISTTNISLRANGINASLSSVSTNTSTGLVTMTFSCTANPDASTRSVYVDVTQGPNTRTCRVIQAASTGAFDGITIKATSGNWVLGTVDSGSAIGIIIAKNSAITSDATATIGTIAWQFQPTAGVTPISYTDTNLSQTIVAGQTLTVNDKTYYGYWMNSTAAGGTAIRPNLQINQLTNFGVSGG